LIKEKQFKNIIKLNDDDLSNVAGGRIKLGKLLNGTYFAVIQDDKNGSAVEAIFSKLNFEKLIRVAIKEDAVYHHYGIMKYGVLEVRKISLDIDVMLDSESDKKVILKMQNIVEKSGFRFFCF
jgi:hypothetical protein